MTASNWIRVGTDHRAEASRDNRTGIVYVRIRRHKRGKAVSFTREQWADFATAVRAGDIDQLIARAMAEASRG